MKPHLTSLFHFFTTASALKEEKKILILFPAQSDMPAYTFYIRGIKSALEATSEFRFEYFIEDMDRYRNDDQTHYRQLLDLYHFEQMLSELSARFVGAPPDQAGKEIERMLEFNVDVLHVDRVSVYKAKVRGLGVLGYSILEIRF